MTSESNDLAPLRLAIDASRQAMEAGDGPYGATLVNGDGQVLHTARNTRRSSADCSAHAEMVLVREAESRFGIGALQGSTVYASGEPCAMCSGALFWAGVRRIVFAVPNRTLGELLGGSLLPMGCAQTLRGATPAVQVDGPLLEDEGLVVLREAAAQQQRKSV